MYCTECVQYCAVAIRTTKYRTGIISSVTSVLWPFLVQRGLHYSLVVCSDSFSSSCGSCLHVVLRRSGRRAEWPDGPSKAVIITLDAVGDSRLANPGDLAGIGHSCCEPMTRLTSRTALPLPVLSNKPIPISSPGHLLFLSF